MISTQDLSSVYELFGQGLMIGSLMSATVWAVSFAIKAFVSWLSSAS